MCLKPTCGFRHTGDKISLLLVIESQSPAPVPYHLLTIPAHSLSFHLKALGLMHQPGLFCHQMSHITLHSSLGH